MLQVTSALGWATRFRTLSAIAVGLLLLAYLAEPAQAAEASPGDDRGSVATSTVTLTLTPTAGGKAGDKPDVSANANHSVESIFCELSASGWYEDGHVLGNSFDQCSVPVDAFVEYMYWFDYSSGVLIQSEVPRWCYNTWYCTKSGVVATTALTNLMACGTVYKGNAAATACTEIYGI